MRELIRSNDAVLIGYAEALLRDAGIGALVLDQNMSIVEGSLGILPRRLMVEPDRYDAAVRLMKDAGLSEHVFEPGLF